MTPGMQVKVVNSYEAASLSVDVIKLRNVDYKKYNQLEHVLTIKDMAQLVSLLPCRLRGIRSELL